MKKLVVLGELRIFLAFSFRMYDSVHPFHDKFNKDTPVQDYLVMFIFSLNSKREQKSKNLLGLKNSEERHFLCQGPTGRESSSGLGTRINVKKRGSGSSNDGDEFVRQQRTFFASLTKSPRRINPYLQISTIFEIFRLEILVCGGKKCLSMSFK